MVVSKVLVFCPEDWGDDPIWLADMFQMCWFNRNRFKSIQKPCTHSLKVGGSKIWMRKLTPKFWEDYLLDEYVFKRFETNQLVLKRSCSCSSSSSSSSSSCSCSSSSSSSSSSAVLGVLFNHIYLLRRTWISVLFFVCFSCNSDLWTCGWTFNLWFFQPKNLQHQTSDLWDPCVSRHTHVISRDYFRSH